MSENKIKKITIGVLIFCILVMSIAYASLFQQLNINGNASVLAAWKVEIVGIKEGNKTSGATNVSIPTYTSTTASFDAKLRRLSDSIEYLVTIRNSGGLPAKLESIEISKTGSDVIIYEISGVNEGDIIDTDETVTVTIRVSGDTTFIMGEESHNAGITVAFNYVQSV